MAFGQQSGPPATTRQVQELLALVRAAGHSDFRDARGPMGFTQRQAAGKFTRDEAAAFIEQLEQLEQLEEAGDGPEADQAAPPRRRPSPPAPSNGPEADQAAPPRRRPSPPAPGDQKVLRRLPADQLAVELERRGWIVIPP